jgi:hypothetical protein
MDRNEFFEMIYSENDPEDPWYTFYQTRDWYHIPNTKRDNDWLYRDRDAIQRKHQRIRPGRHFIYPIDIQLMYDCTQEEALSLINDVRESLALSVSGPITYSDLQEHTQLNMQVILDFIMES